MACTPGRMTCTLTVWSLLPPLTLRPRRPAAVVDTDDELRCRGNDTTAAPSIASADADTGRLGDLLLALRLVHE